MRGGDHQVGPHDKSRPQSLSGVTDRNDRRRHTLDDGYDQVDVTQEARDAWMDLCLSAPRIGVIGSPECTPGYYNNEGQPGGLGREWFLGYPGGAQAYFQYLDQWRNSGDFEGLEFRVR